MHKLIWILKRNFRQEPVKTLVAVLAPGFVGFFLFAYGIAPAIRILTPYEFSRWFFRSDIAVFLSLFVWMALAYFLSRDVPWIRTVWNTDTTDYTQPEKKPFMADIKSGQAFRIFESNSETPQTAPSPKTPDSVFHKHMKPREYPRGIQLIRQRQDELIFTVKAVHRRWRFVPGLIALFGFPIIIPLGLYGGFAGGYWRGQQYIPSYFTYAPLILGCCLVFGLMIWAWFQGHLRLKIIALSDQILVDRMVFDRTHFTGMLIGYTVNSKDGVKLGFLDQSIGDHFMGFTGLRVGYGQWGEDTNFMLNKYHAPEYCVWMNAQIAQIGAPAPKENDPSQGQKAAVF